MKHLEFKTFGDLEIFYGQDDLDFDFDSSVLKVFLKKGLGQSEGGYILNRWQADFPDTDFKNHQLVFPNQTDYDEWLYNTQRDQKWHLLESWFKQTKIKAYGLATFRQTGFGARGYSAYCPELFIWMYEVAGVLSDEEKADLKNFIVSYRLQNFKNKNEYKKALFANIITPAERHQLDFMKDFYNFKHLGLRNNNK